ncbi:seleno T [Micractinium conductrix]|uniref:Seleno T n=1 Tax=Micractinium conductrix TaxID=554055 RepID=A0A2P6VPZ5_9CHLO|nr:seleno T [Micractinium conductrix]|eukprot:PSC76151.1 seleno T [Micractinium conductrix]
MMGLWFIGNTVRQNLLSTGAFEVSYAGTPIFSKLATGRMPTLADVVEGVGEAMAAGGATTQ